MSQQDHFELLHTFWKSFSHHQTHPTQHGLRLFIANIELARSILKHAQDDLAVLHAAATKLLHDVELEDHFVAEYVERLPAERVTPVTN